MNAVEWALLVMTLLNSVVIAFLLARKENRQEFGKYYEFSHEVEGDMPDVPEFEEKRKEPYERSFFS